MNKISVKNLNLYYSKFHALKNISVDIPDKKITAIIGPSGCGKSTLLRVFNRMNDFIKDVKITGEIIIDGININNNNNIDLDALRKKVGMVFQRPNPFPLSIYENVAFGLRIHNLASNKKLDEIVKKSLRAVLLWDELKDKLNSSALKLSLEKKQRLCIARLIAVAPDILLFDEPCSALDPISTNKIEELMIELKKNYTIIIVTHNMQQAARISDYCGFMLLGELVEFDETNLIFTNPKNNKTQDYITGRFG